MGARIELDRTDLRLLTLLQHEGRLSNTELAERVALSPSACLRRVQRLEQSGVIRGYAAEVDPKAIGLGLMAFVRVQLASHGSAEIRRFAESVSAWNEVIACYALTGDMDYLLQVQVEDLEHFSRFVLEKLVNSAGVADMNSSFVLQAVKHTRVLPIPGAQAAPARKARSPAAARSRK